MVNLGNPKESVREGVQDCSTFGRKKEVYEITQFRAHFVFHSCSSQEERRENSFKVDGGKKKL